MRTGRGGGAGSCRGTRARCQFLGNLLSEIASKSLRSKETPMPSTLATPLLASISDGELVRRALAGDEPAIRAILQANNRRLFRIARGILRNDSEAEDVVQETYVRALTHLRGFRGDSSLSTWLSRIAMNEAMGRLRGQHLLLQRDSLLQQHPEAEIIQF